MTVTERGEEDDDNNSEQVMFSFFVIFFFLTKGRRESVCVCGGEGNDVVWA